MGAIIDECIEDDAVAASELLLEPIIAESPLDADAWCASMTVGNYPYPGLDDTCVPFVYCYASGGGVRGQVIDCYGTSKFNPATRSCQAGFVCEIE